MKRVLVTGAGGYVGRQTIGPLAARGFEIHAASRHPPALPAIAAHAVDILDAAATAALVARLRPTHLLHLAWTTAHGRYWTDPANDAWMQATLALLDAFAAGGGTRAVLAGTCAAYDWSQPMPLDEAAPGEPATTYGRAKRATFAAAMARGGLSLAEGRIFFSYGAGEDPARFVPAIIRPLLHGEPARLTAGTQIRDFLEVRDLGAAMAALLDSPVTGGVNLATGTGIALADLARAIAAAIGRPDLLELGALPMRAGEPPVLTGRAERLTREVGFTPAIPLGRGIADAVAWWRGTGAQVTRP